MSLLDRVNIFQGADSTHDFSTGNTYPVVAAPWGMTFWAPQAGGEAARFYTRRGSHPVGKFEGVRATHQPSPWIGDYGHFLLTPIVGEAGATVGRRASGYRLDEEAGRPDGYRVRLLRYGTTAEVTATERCGVLRFTYPEAEDAAIVLSLFSEACEARWEAGSRRVVGVSRASTTGAQPANFGCYFVAEVDAAVREAAPTPGGGLTLRFAARAEQAVTIRVGTSFISSEQAALNLEREVGTRGFDETRAGLAAVWEAALGRVELTGGSERQWRTFYSCLYRALLFPRVFHEVDAAGATVHYSPYDGAVHAGVMYADNGFWDTYRTVYPLLALLHPERYGEMVAGWVNAWREGGWYPRWSCPGYRSCMIGTHLAAVIADACVKGIGGFDLAAAYEGMRKDATVPGDPAGRWGREGLEDYWKHGYVPDDLHPDSVARTLDYAYSDWCCAVVAEKLGRQDDAATFRERAGNWRNLFDPKTGFLRPRRGDGSWVEPFDPFCWGRAYVEGGAWQFRFHVPHDLEGLAEALGGTGALVDAVEAMLTTPPTFHAGRYGQEIHEMTEMAAVGFGQYAHSNQPVHAFLWLPAQLGRPEVTDRAVRRVLEELYTPDRFCGDEDNGEMGAWYVLAAMGLYAPCPGDEAYVRTRPLFDRVRVTADSGRAFELRADAALGAARAVAYRDLWR